MYPLVRISIWSICLIAMWAGLTAPRPPPQKDDIKVAKKQIFDVFRDMLVIHVKASFHYFQIIVKKSKKLMIHTDTIRLPHIIRKLAAALTPLPSSTISPNKISSLSQQPIDHIHQLITALQDVFGWRNHGSFRSRTASLVLSYTREHVQFCRPYIEEAYLSYNRTLCVRSTPKLYRSDFDPHRDRVHVPHSNGLSEPVQDNAHPGNLGYSILADRRSIFSYLPHQTLRDRRQTVERCVPGTVDGLSAQCTVENLTLHMVNHCKNYYHASLCTVD